jgi:capsular exopolysaccharide synthesis family protein
VEKTKHDLAAIERKMANEISSGLERMSEEYKASFEKKAKLETLLKEGLAEAINKYKDLKDLLVTKQKTYEDLVAEINDLKYSYKLSAARTFNVTEYPVKPDKPFNEDAREKAKKRGIFSALIIAVLASFGLAFALEFMDTSIKEVDEIEALGWVVLAVVPRKKKLGIELGRKHIEVNEPHSFLKEVFSSLRVNLQFIAADKGLKAIAITSANPDEGKTFVAVNLATVCALAGEKTLLVEGDLRNPGLCDYFHETNLKEAPCTFAGLIEGGEPKPCPTPIENLWVMPAGSLSGKLDVILGRERIHACVTNWKREFDWIFFDIPALQTEGHDVIILKNSDAIVPVVLANKTPRKSLMHLIATLQNLKTNVLGFVLDGVTAIGDHRYFYSYVKKK